MRYMLLIYENEHERATRSDADEQALTRAHAGLVSDLRERGKFVAGAPLHTTDSATTVRVRSDSTWVTDGPFAETSEQLLGYCVIDGENLDDAIAIAKRIPTAAHGSIEIRPIRNAGSAPERPSQSFSTQGGRLP